MATPSHDRCLNAVIASLMAYQPDSPADTTPNTAIAIANKFFQLVFFSSEYITHMIPGTAKLPRHPPIDPPISSAGLTFGKNIAMSNGIMLDMSRMTALLHPVRSIAWLTLNRMELHEQATGG